MCLPWVLWLLGPVEHRSVLVLPPTLPGVAWVLDRDEARAILVAERPMNEVGFVNAALQAGVAHAGPLVTLSKGAFDAAVRLGPTQPPPGGEELRQIASAIRPGGRLALSFRVRDGESVDLGAKWCLLRGDPSVIPGLAGFSSSRFANTAAWYGEQQHRIGVLLCGRVADAE